MKVKIKSWERMVEENEYSGKEEIYLDEDIVFTSKMEELLPDDRIIEVGGLNSDGFYPWINIEKWEISAEMIEEYLTDESGNDLTNPLHPANSELLPRAKSEQEFKLKSLAEIPEEECCQKIDEVDLDNPEHPANQELLPELDAFKLANNNLAIFKQIQNKSHLCHYTKFQLDFDINASIRFIHAFDDRPELVGKFIYKHHEEKLVSVIAPQLAEHFIKTQCSNEAEEFINRYVGQGKKKQYRRIKVTENSLTKYFES